MSEINLNSEANRPGRPGDVPDHNQKAKGGSLLPYAIIGVVLLIVGIVFFSVLPRMRQNRALAGDAKKERNAVPQVVVIPPHPSPDADLTLPGTTQAIEDATIGARSTGYVRRRYVDIGSRVKAGDTLAEIEAPDVDAQLLQAKQQTAQATATVRQAESDVANKQAVVAQNQSAVRQAEANVETARAQQADAEAKRAQAQAQQANTEAQLSQVEHVVDIKRAALKQAQTQLDLAAVTLKRYQTLLKAGYVALQDVDQSQATYDNALAAVNSAQADVSAAQANVKAAQETVSSAKSNVQAAAAQVSAAQKNVKAVAATVNSARATVTAARANVRSSQSVVQSNQAGVRGAQANEQRLGVLTGFSKITAPFAGVITARNVDVGTLINGGSGAGGSSQGGSSSQGSAAASSSSPGTTPSGGLFGLARTDTLRVLVSVPQTYSRLIRPGQTVSLAIREFPGRAFLGSVSHVSGAIDSVSRTLLAEVHIPNQEGTLLPGMYAQVHFDLPKTAGALRIPSNTLLSDALGTRVLVVTPENKLHFVPIKVGRDFGTELEVTEGLQGKESLVSNPSDDLVEGEKVDPKQAPPPPLAPPGTPPGTPSNGQPKAPPSPSAGNR